MAEKNAKKEVAMLMATSFLSAAKSSMNVLLKLNHDHLMT